MSLKNIRNILGAPKVVIGASTIRSNGVDVTKALTLAGHKVDTPVAPEDVYGLMMRVAETMKSAAASGAEWAKTALWKAGAGVRYITGSAVGPRVTRAAGTNLTIPDPSRAAAEFHPPTPDPSTPKTPDAYIARFGTRGAEDNRPFYVSDNPTPGSYADKIKRSLATRECVECGRAFTTAVPERKRCAGCAGTVNRE